MKLWKISIILVAVIGISAGAYFGISKSVEKKELEQIESSGAKALFDFSSEDIKTISFTSNDETLEFSTEDGSAWTCTNQNINPYNNNITLAVTTMAELNTTKIIEENASNLSIYGLDNPVTVSCSDGVNEYSIQVGNISPTGESYYIKSVDNNDVYTVSFEDGAIMHMEKDDLKNRYILDTSLYSVNKIIYSDGDSVVFNCEKGDTGSWNLIEPNISNVDVDITKISSIIDLIIRADAVDFISENPTDAELTEYGLDNPKYTIELGSVDDNGEHDTIIYFGNSPQDNVIYGQFADTKQVATFYMGEIGILDSTAEVVLSDTLYKDDLKNITNLKVDYNQQTLDIGITYNSNDRSYSYTLDGKPLGSTDSNYSTIVDLVASSLNIILYSFEPDITPTGEPEFTITYTRNYEPNEYTLKFIPDEESKYYYILMDDEYFGCVVRKRTLYSDRSFLTCLDSLLNIS